MWNFCQLTHSTVLLFSHGKTTTQENESGVTPKLAVKYVELNTNGSTLLPCDMSETTAKELAWILQNKWMDGCLFVVQQSHHIRA